MRGSTEGVGRRCYGRRRSGYAEGERITKWEASIGEIVAEKMNLWRLCRWAFRALPFPPRDCTGTATACGGDRFSPPYISTSSALCPPSLLATAPEPPPHTAAIVLALSMSSLLPFFHAKQVSLRFLQLFHLLSLAFSFDAIRGVLCGHPFRARSPRKSRLIGSEQGNETPRSGMART
ncbi:hypothetical protein NL676_018505 [Syzygium grande]|nr:hypothetical protein NL676_018505 [Syzygium grande]